MPSTPMQQTLMSVKESFKSFKKLLKKSIKGELNQKPNVPKYRKSGGLFTVTYPKKWLKLIEGKIRFPLGEQVRAWFGLTEFFLPFPVNLKWELIKEVRIVPRNTCLYAEFVDQQIHCELKEGQSLPTHLDSTKVLGIDHGLNNWLTCVSNVGTSFIVDGRHLKSINQGYNKKVSTLMKGKDNGFWSKRLANLTEKRNRTMKDAINKTARRIINHCLNNQIGTIIFGWNKGQKDSINLGKKTNHSFLHL
jgi:transposase